VSLPDLGMHVADATDGLASLPDASVDLIVTDPAYQSLEKHRNQGTTARLGGGVKSNRPWFPVVPNSYFPRFFCECFRVLKRKTYLFVFCDDETSDVIRPMIIDAAFTWRKRLVWFKQTVNPQRRTCPHCDETLRCQRCGHEHREHNPAMGMGYPFRAAYEFIAFAQKGKRKPPPNRSMLDVFPCPIIKNPDAYPTEKPTDLIEQLIGQGSVEGDLVVDPFAGSGAVLKAGSRMGRRVIGFDILESTVEAYAGVSFSPVEEPVEGVEVDDILSLFGP
jgi:site-specific DNA-methyltransferase (adenine-specific)